MMKKFILKVLFFSLPILIVSIMLELLLQNIPNDYSYKNDYLDENAEKIETLILGSSHSFYGVDPVYFSGQSFNASQISQPLNFDFEILKKYEESFQELKTIVLPISYFSLYYNLETSVEFWRVKNYMIYYDLNSSESLEDYSEVLSNKLNINLKKLMRCYVNNDKAIFCSEKGWGTSYKSENAVDLLKAGPIAAKIHTKERDSSVVQEVFKENVQVLNSLLGWSEKRNIKVLLFTPPAYHTYYENLDDEQLSITLDKTRKICSKYDNCIYNNMMRDTSFVAADFFDSDHLSEVGTKKLSILLNDQITNWGKVPPGK